MKKQKQTFTTAVGELEAIIAKLESDKEMDMDVLTGEVEKATKLLTFCKKELTTIDLEVEKMIEDIES